MVAFRPKWILKRHTHTLVRRIVGRDVSSPGGVPCGGRYALKDSTASSSLFSNRSSSFCVSASSVHAWG